MPHPGYRVSMRTSRPFLSLLGPVFLLQCTSEDPAAPADASGGAVSSGGGAQGTGGTPSGGGATGGSAGSAGSGGASTGGKGAASGGAVTTTGGASSSGGSASGGTSSGGASPSTGGSAGSGGTSAGSGGASNPPSPRRAACEGGPNTGNPLPSNRTAGLVKNGFGFIEGPVWLASKSTLYFSDMNFNGGDALGPPARIRSMSLAGGSAVFDTFVPSANSNGLALANDGRILAGTHDVQSLSYFDPANGNRTQWPLTVGGKHFNSPNDLVVRSDGNVYFTDPSWQLGSRTSETGVEGLYRVSPSGTVTLIDSAQQRVNGVTLSPDENTLYAAGLGGGVYAFSLDAAGVASNKRKFADGYSDGMTVDCAGNVYTTRGSVVVLNPAGNEIGRITVSESSNVAFGGPERRTLYITAQSSLYSIELNVRGMPY